MLTPVAELNAGRDAIPILAELGYRQADHRPQEALWFYKQKGEDYESRTLQLHLMRVDSNLWRERLGFRDALRQDGGLRDEYAALKQALSQEADLAAYTDGKRAFVLAVLATEGIDL